MTREQIHASVRALLGEHLVVPDDDDAPLELESFVLVVVAEDLEPRLGVKVTAKDVVPGNFSTVNRLVDFVLRRRAG